jgi:3-hydroxyisobutyrate dehydrogenase-like beta-hydroxyacid dehydrogenase
MNAASRKHRLGWIGLGRMGLAMVERVAKAGADVRGYNRTRTKAESLSNAGVVLVDRPADLAECDIVFSMVSDADALRTVTFGSDGLFSRPDQRPQILVELSTISTEASAEIRSLAAMRGTDMLVVPVSGNDVVARAGKLSVMASGPRSAFDAVRPYLACFGPSVTYVGEGDVARIVKICHNLYLAIAFEGLAEVTLLAEKHGVPRHVFLDVINKSVLGSTFSRYKTPVIANLDYTVTFTNTLMQKDLDLGLKAARQSGVVLPATQVVRDIVQSCIEDGQSEADYTIILDKLAQLAGMTLRSENAGVTDGLS